MRGDNISNIRLDNYIIFFNERFRELDLYQLRRKFLSNNFNFLTINSKNAFGELASIALGHIFICYSINTCGSRNFDACFMKEIYDLYNFCLSIEYFRPWALRLHIDKARFYTTKQLCSIFESYKHYDKCATLMHECSKMIEAMSVKDAQTHISSNRILEKVYIDNLL